MEGSADAAIFYPVAIDNTHIDTGVNMQFNGAVRFTMVQKIMPGRASKNGQQ